MSQNTKVISFLLMLSACASESSDPLTRKLRQCYTESDSYTGMKGKVQGKMLVKYELDPEAKVRNFRIIESDFPKDYNLNACVEGVFKNSVWEKPDSGHTEVIEKPITFQAVKH